MSGERITDIPIPNECKNCIFSAFKQFRNDVPEKNIEKLTDKEQRIFLAAMGREEKVCKEVDAETIREPYEESLVRVCREIERKVKTALWT